MTGRIICLAAACLVIAIVAGAQARAQQRLAGFDLMLVDLDGGKKVLGRLPPSVFAPRLSPDGTRVAFETRDRSGPDGARLWIADVSDLAGRHAVENPVGPLDWAPMWTLDSERLVFIVSNEKGDADMSSRAVTPLVVLPGSSQHSSAVSPDGRWLAYASNETGRYELFLEPLPRRAAIRLHFRSKDSCRASIGVSSI